MMDQISANATVDPGWKRLYRVGGAAALMAGVLFRRNLAAEIALFGAQEPPDTVTGWFTLLQTNRLLGLAYLNLFDLVNYALVALMLLALYVVLRRGNKSAMAIAVASGCLGIGVYFASNTALSMLSLSDQYAAATTEAQRAPLLAAGHALVALNRFSSPDAHPGSGGYISLLLIAAAGLIISLVMRRSAVFNRATAWVGTLAGGLDLIYCSAYVFVPMGGGKVLALGLVPAAGLLWMIWHISVGWRLYRLGRLEAETIPKQA
jgi:hypothetical protein